MIGFTPYPLGYCPFGAFAGMLPLWGLYLPPHVCLIVMNAIGIKKFRIFLFECYFLVMLLLILYIIYYRIDL